MSRKGNMPIAIPTGVEVKLEAKKISIKGPKGNLEHMLVPEVQVNMDANVIKVKLADQLDGDSSYHGLYRTLIHNMVHGVSKGFEKRLEMIGVGYRAAVQGHQLDLQVGYSHPTKLQIPSGVHVAVDKNTKIIISGADKQVIGQFAANVRSVRPPEPYRGKGIRYEGEHVRKKAGKTAGAKK